MDINSERLNHLLQTAGKIMDEERTPDIRIVVSGGAALLAQGFVSRSTHDVDVFAQREVEGDLISGFPLPDWFQNIILRIAKVEGLRNDWVNASTSLIGHGLENIPSHFFNQLEEKEYGDRLRVGFLSREALIFLKAHTIFDRNEARDRIDFAALNPTRIQIEHAVGWLTSHSLIPQEKTHDLIATLSQIAGSEFDE